MKKDDLTTGPMASHFRTLAVPAAFGMLFTTLYYVVDVYYAGLLSTEAQAGLAISYQAFFVVIEVGISHSSALSTLASKTEAAAMTTRTRAM